MLPLEHHRIQITFDDQAWSTMPGCSFRPPWPWNLGLRQLVDHHLDLGDAAGAGERGRQDDDPDRLCAGGRRLHRTPCVARRRNGRCSRLYGKGAIHTGHFPAQLPVGPRPPAGPGEPRVAGPCLGSWGGSATHHSPSTLDSTICETYGLAKEGARHHGYTGQRGYHPLLAVAAGTGDVLMARLREGRANTARGAAHFLRETVGRVRHAGVTGQLTMRAVGVSLMGWYPSAARQRSVSEPSASVPACAISSPYPRMPGRPSPIGWRAPPMWPRPLTRPSEASPMPRRCSSSSGG